MSHVLPIWDRLLLEELATMAGERLVPILEELAKGRCLSVSGCGHPRGRCTCAKRGAA